MLVSHPRGLRERHLPEQFSLTGIDCSLVCYLLGPGTAHYGEGWRAVANRIFAFNGVNRKALESAVPRISAPEVLTQRWGKRRRNFRTVWVNSDSSTDSK
jgi:hypothetical protein